jgi:TRAP-type C4-dicarboxylate transport system permease small subunit
MSTKTGSLMEWVVPSAFLVCAGWVVWHMPAFILDFFPPANASNVAQIQALNDSKEVLPGLPGLFGGTPTIVDWLALILVPITFVLGLRTQQVAHMEFQHWRAIDRVGIFIGRVTMMMILVMTGVMLYEVFLRYVIEAPTLWANELTLWIAGFVFLISGFYAMQQRSHIRITMLYDVVPRNVQRLFDILSAAMVVIFAIGLIFGSYKQVFIIKFQKWEMFGTAFDPPIPATIQPTILIVIALVAIQAVVNVIADWNLEPEIHSPDEIDEEELEAIKRSLGAE